MQANRPAVTPPAARTFTETARRAQIVDAAIATIAELGYRNASFAQIARRAGLSSTGLISYHFKNRDDLMSEIVDEVIGVMGRHMAARLADPELDAAAALRAYIEGTIEFIDGNREPMRALMEIFLGGGFEYGGDEERTAISPLEQILRRGQRAGEFRRFDAKVMATVIQRAIDGLPFLLATDPGLDVRAYGAEVATMFELATRRGGP
jgi:AcrR family transcriptional regulator